MNKHTYLSERRKQYLELAKLYFYEVQKGSPIEGLNFLKEKIDILQKEIAQLESEIEEGNNSNEPAD